MIILKIWRYNLRFSLPSGIYYWETKVILILRLISKVGITATSGLLYDLDEVISLLAFLVCILLAL